MCTSCSEVTRRERSASWSSTTVALTSWSAPDPYLEPRRPRRPHEYGGRDHDEAGEEGNSFMGPSFYVAGGGEITWRRRRRVKNRQLLDALLIGRHARARARCFA